jgi:hypothetical protein
MAEAITSGHVYQLLKCIQDDVAVIKETAAEHSQLLADVREHDSWLRALQAETLFRCGRIEHRLGTTDSPWFTPS